LIRPPRTGFRRIRLPSRSEPAGNQDRVLRPPLRTPRWRTSYEGRISATASWVRPRCGHSGSWLMNRPGSGGLPTDESRLVNLLLC
jgi:hypothetical protein